MHWQLGVYRRAIFRCLLFSSFFCIFFLLLTAIEVKAALPTGHLDKAGGGIISGWAKDDDYNGPLPVHIYVDGRLYEDTLADLWKSTLGGYSFNYKYSPLGKGNHKVEVYAIGVDTNGVPDGQNVLLSPAKYIDENCNGLSGSSAEWCQNNGRYWENRQKDTTYLWNKYIRIGINNSYGGTITQLYSEDRSFNLIDEHGGAAVQLSLYGYDLSKGESGAWFVSDGSNCDKYSSRNICEDNNLGKTCIERGAANGAHVADCVNVLPCVNNKVDAGFPFNPIQAQGVNCSWEDVSNDVNYSASCGLNCWEIRLNNPVNYSKSTRFDGLSIDQKVTLGDVYARVDYEVTYNGRYTLSVHEQEIPAFFTNVGVDKKFQFYSGNEPGNLDSSVTEVSLGVGTRELALPNFRQEATPYAKSGEYWLGVCSSDNIRCITIATFSKDVEKLMMKVFNNGGAYIAPTGSFNIFPGMKKSITLYIFPYRYDRVIDGKSVRRRILELKGDWSNIDFNQDGKVNIFDYNILVSNFGKTGNPGFIPSDINKDGKVDIFDYNILVSEFGKN